MIKPSDPNIRVGIEMPASVYHRLTEHARARKVSMSRLCRDGALKEMERMLLEKLERVLLEKTLP